MQNEAKAASIHWLLVAGGVLCVLYAWFGKEQGTSGYALVITGCFLGILARIVQAESHHKELLEQNGKRTSSASA